jgi:uncharacterized membrane protein YdjX (TVP38/TMEM64 family)
MAAVAQDCAVEPAGPPPPARPLRRPNSTYGRVVCMPESTAESILCVLHWGVLAVGLLVVLIYVLPRFLGPTLLEWAFKIRMRLTKTQVGVVCTLAIWVLTMIFIPCQPFAWIATFVFNEFAIPFLIIEIGTTLGFVCAFLLGRTLMGKPAHQLFDKYPATKAILEAIDRLGAFKVVFLMRWGPLPYSFVSYVSSVPKGLPFLPYCAASFLALAPRNALIIYLGTNFVGLVELFTGKQANVGSTVFNLIALFVAILLVVGGTFYCRRIMNELVRREGEVHADLEAAHRREEEAEVAAAKHCGEEGAVQVKAGGPAAVKHSGEAGGALARPDDSAARDSGAQGDVQVKHADSAASLAAPVDKETAAAAAEGQGDVTPAPMGNVGGAKDQQSA